MIRTIREFVVVAFLAAGCGDDVAVPACTPEQVYSAQTCSEGVVQCQAHDGTPVDGCFLRLMHTPGEPYEAVCVTACPAR